MTEETNESMSEVTPAESTESVQTEPTDVYHTGCVKWFENRRGFGFIIDIDTGKDVFVHNRDISVVNPSTYRKLFSGEYVSFKIGKQDDGREKCISVTGIRGGPLLVDNEEYNYRSYPKNNDYSTSEYKSAPTEEYSGGDGDADDGDADEDVKEVINKEAPEGIEIQEIDGLHVSETLGQ